MSRINVDKNLILSCNVRWIFLLFLLLLSLWVIHNELYVCTQFRRQNCVQRCMNDKCRLRLMKNDQAHNFTHPTWFEQYFSNLLNKISIFSQFLLFSIILLQILKPLLWLATILEHTYKFKLNFNEFNFLSIFKSVGTLSSTSTSFLCCHKISLPFGSFYNICTCMLPL
jgi:hypothetical protein